MCVCVCVCMCVCVCVAADRCCFCSTFSCHHSSDKDRQDRLCQSMVTYMEQWVCLFYCFILFVQSSVAAPLPVLRPKTVTEEVSWKFCRGCLEQA